MSQQKRSLEESLAEDSKRKGEYVDDLLVAHLSAMEGKATLNPPLSVPPAETLKKEKNMIASLVNFYDNSSEDSSSDSSDFSTSSETKPEKETTIKDDEESICSIREKMQNMNGMFDEESKTGNEAEMNSTKYEWDENLDKPLPSNVKNEHLVLAGVIQSHIIADRILVVESIGEDKSILDVGTNFFFINEAKEIQKIGYVFDVIGPIKQHLYLVRLPPPPKTKDTIDVWSIKGIYTTALKPHQKCFYLPETTVFLNTSDILRNSRKGCDASKEKDVEIPFNELEYSDDELERRAKKTPSRIKHLSRPVNTAPTPQSLKSIPNNYPYFNANKSHDHPRNHSYSTIKNAAPTYYSYPHPPPHIYPHPPPHINPQPPPHIYPQPPPHIYPQPPPHIYPQPPPHTYPQSLPHTYPQPPPPSVPHNLMQISYSNNHQNQVPTSTNTALQTKPYQHQLQRQSGSDTVYYHQNS